ncbi:hypothetical protein [Rhodohalobacter sp. 8-1]|uniref:hypothetical protein n=1 Tax=Rhodohalobacter sp. 8-1 TaxID=3131972 RepID=UPI0030ECB3F2
MNNTKIVTTFIVVTSICLIAFIVSSCNESQSTISDTISQQEFSPEASELVVKGGGNLVEVTTGHDHDANLHTFDLNIDKVPEGWTRFQLTNATHADHFFLLYEVPEAAIDAASNANQSVLDHWYDTVTYPFQTEWNPYFEGSIGWGTFVNNLFGAVLSSAPWFPDAVIMGGPGITAAGTTSQTTVYLEEGLYIAECYVKDENGEFHSFNGMLAMLEVTGETSKEREPRATMKVSISSQQGIEHPESVRPGKHTVAINYEDQAIYGHLVGHNVQLVRFDDGYDSALLSELEAWMDWSDPDAFIDNSPEGTTFLGGAMEMTEGSTAYYTVNLKPGTYAWIAEVPDASEKNMLKTFSVPFGRNMK